MLFRSTHQVVNVFREHWAYTPAKAEAELGYKPRTLKDGLRLTLEWLKDRQLIPNPVR